MNNNIVPNSFVAISDFHSCKWPFEKMVNHYLNEYDKIFILGDAIDRGPKGNGEGGLSLLLKIKELCDKYKGRVCYIPGNHDGFLYDYAKSGDKDLASLICYNGGSKTIKDFDELRETNPKKAEELLNWLGKLPIQVTHEYNNQKYALAHAFFNATIYKKNPKFNLNKLYTLKNNSKLYRYCADIVWFRKGKDLYDNKDVPSNDTIIIIGHTPEGSRKGQNLDLKNADGDTVKVHCVDGGIVYDNKMLKYDGGIAAIKTDIGAHNDTSPKNKMASKKQNFKLSEPENEQTENLDNFEQEQEDLFKEIIIEFMKKSDNLEKTYAKIIKFCLTGNRNLLPRGNNLRYRARDLSRMSILNLIANYAEQRDEKLKLTSIVSLCKDYVNETCLDYIILSLEEKFKSKEAAKKNLRQFFKTRDYTWITESVGKARTIAYKLDHLNMINVIENRCDYFDLDAYFELKFGKKPPKQKKI